MFDDVAQPWAAQGKFAGRNSSARHVGFAASTGLVPTATMAAPVPA